MSHHFDLKNPSPVAANEVLLELSKDTEIVLPKIEDNCDLIKVEVKREDLNDSQDKEFQYFSHVLQNNSITSEDNQPIDRQRDDTNEDNVSEDSEPNPSVVLLEKPKQRNDLQIDCKTQFIVNDIEDNINPIVTNNEFSAVNQTSIFAPRRTRIGTIVCDQFGVRKKFTGKCWRRLCARQGCDGQRHDLQQGLCIYHYREMKANESSGQTSSVVTSDQSLSQFSHQTIYLPFGRTMNPNNGLYVCHHNGCGKQFRNSYFLKKHQLDHKVVYSMTLGKQYVCPYQLCNYRSLYESSYENHVKQQHFESQEKTTDCSSADIQVKEIPISTIKIEPKVINKAIATETNDNFEYMSQRLVSRQSKTNTTPEKLESVDRPLVGAIITDELGVRKRITAKKSMRLCARNGCHNCSKIKFQYHFVSRYIELNDNHSNHSQSSPPVTQIASNPSSSAASQTEVGGTPPRGTTVRCPNGIRKMFDGRRWLRLCSWDNCPNKTKTIKYCLVHIGRPERPNVGSVSQSAVNVSVNKDSLADRFVTCSVCSKAFINRHLLEKHMKSHFSRCPHRGCDAVFNNQPQLRQHTYREHSIRCQWKNCEFRTSKKCWMSYHMSAHLNERNFQCQWKGCHRRFNKKQTLKYHMKIHSDEKNHICRYPGCDFRAKTSSVLYYHKKVQHNTEHKYVCEYGDCRKRFRSKMALSLHYHHHHKPLDKEQTEPKTKRSLVTIDTK